MKKLIIIGAGGHGRVVADIAASTEQYSEILFLDDDERKQVSPYRLSGKASDFINYISDSDFVVAVGSNIVRAQLVKKLELSGAHLASLIHKSAVIGSNVTIGKGSVIGAGAVVNNGATIGNGVIINTCASVDHDCVIGNYTHVSVGAHIAGSVSVGENCFVCAGVTVINNVNICDNCVIGAGATVIGNITEGGTYIGTPTKKIK